MGTYRLFPSASGPPSSVAYAGDFAAGTGFQATAGGTWLEGYWWWVCPAGQLTAPQVFALWQVHLGGIATLIDAATVKSGDLTPGQWNYVPLPAPIMLSAGGGSNFDRADGGGTAAYIACTGFTGGFPDTNDQFGAGEPYAAGITNGPLTAFSDQGGSLPGPWTLGQGLFGTDSDVTAKCPFNVSGSSNFWMDVQVSDTAPSGYTGSYRIWPNLPVVPGAISNDEGRQTAGTEFWLSQACTLDAIWFWSPPGAVNLPSRCGIFSVDTQAEVAGTDNSAPSWRDPDGTAASPGDGWITCSYAAAGVTLPAGKYKSCVYSEGGGKFYTEDVLYFSSGPGGRGIVSGPITVPSVAAAASCISGSGPDKGETVTGNSTYQDGPWSYPDTFDGGDGGENRWIDVEVTPVPGGGTTPPPPAAVNSGAFLVFFP
jgi:hypothetical protein